MTRKRIRQMNAALLRRLSRRPAAEYLAGREDLIGFGPKCLIKPPRQPKGRH